MNTMKIERELNTLSLEVYRLRLALQAGSYNQACDKLDTAQAYTEGVARELGVLRAKIINRDLSDELSRSIEAVKGGDAA